MTCALHAMMLLDTEEGRAALNRDGDSYVAIACERHVPVIVETPTWRASTDCGELLGLDELSGR